LDIAFFFPPWSRKSKKGSFGSEQIVDPRLSLLGKLEEGGGRELPHHDGAWFDIRGAKRFENIGNPWMIEYG
jgi:hypothetical protein